MLDDIADRHRYRLVGGQQRAQNSDGQVTHVITLACLPSKDSFYCRTFGAINPQNENEGILLVLILIVTLAFGELSDGHKDEDEDCDEDLENFYPLQPFIAITI